jgi:hypothetical protein
MRITWVSAGAITQNNGELSSPLASVRYRMLSPSRFLTRWGYKIHIASSVWPAEASQWNEALESETLILGKIFDAGVTQVVERALRQGRRVVLDICDDHFDTPQLGNAYRRLCELASDVVASTPAMAEVIARRTGRQATIIDDSYEAPLGEPRFAPGDRLEAVWFGHPVNFDTCLAMLPELIRFSQRRPLRLHVITQPMSGAAPARLRELMEPHAPDFEIRFSPWSQATTWQGIAEADVVLVPSSAAATKQVKSPNRVVESLRLGRFVVAYPLPSYLPLAPYIALNDEMTVGLEWALNNSAAALARIVAGQAYVEQRFSPERVARQWQALLSQTPAGVTAIRPAAPATKPLAPASVDPSTSANTAKLTHVFLDVSDGALPLPAYPSAPDAAQ